MSSRTPQANTTEPDLEWLKRPENREKVSLFLEGYKYLFFLAGKYVSGNPSLEKKFDLNKEYIRFRQKVSDLYDQISTESEGSFTLEYYYPPPADLLTNDDLLAEGDGFASMRLTLGKAKLLFEELGLADTHSPEDFKEHLKDLNHFLNEIGQEHKKELHISYNANLGKFTFNDTDSIKLEGNQKDVADCLVEKGKEVPVSWDELFERIGDNIGPSHGDADIRTVRTAVTEINKHAAKYLPQGKNFVDAKNNEYWLQYEVGKGR